MKTTYMGVVFIVIPFWMVICMNTVGFCLSVLVMVFCRNWMIWLFGASRFL